MASSSAICGVHAGGVVGVTTNNNHRGRTGVTMIKGTPRRRRTFVVPCNASAGGDGSSATTTTATTTTTTAVTFKAPPRTCSAAAAEARSVLRALREGDPKSVPHRVRVELPLPPADMNTDEIRYLGLHGQAADWSGGMQQRYRVTKGYIEDSMLDGEEAATREERGNSALEPTRASCFCV